MTSFYVNIPACGAPSWRAPVPTFIDLPPSGNEVGDAIVTQDTDTIYIWNGSAWIAVAMPGEGTVTSVGLADGSATPIYSISGSPVTSVGTLTFTLRPEPANTVFAGPTSGAPAQPAFRSLVAADIPSLSYVTSVGLADSTGLFNITGSPVTSSGTLTLSSFNSQAANTFLAAPNGSAGAPAFRTIVPADVPTLNQNTTGTAANVTGVVAVVNGGTGVTTSTGTGSVVLSNSPSLISPALDTPSSVTLTNATGLPLTTGVTGTLPVANGGTNATTVAGARTSLGIDAGAQFITSGTTYTTPANITAATHFKFTAVGGGGGGGGFSAAGSSSSGGGGGGGGILFITGLSPSTAYTIAIGAGGTAGTAGTPGAGGAGGNTTLTIGATTYTAAGGGGSPGGASNVNGGAGGAATNFTINIKGRNGNGGADNSPTSSGQGGDAPFGLGLGGAALGTGGVGLAGTGYGGGGGGAHGTAAAGGAGAAGAILVEWSN